MIRSYLVIFCRIYFIWVVMGTFSIHAQTPDAEPSLPEAATPASEKPAIMTLKILMEADADLKQQLAGKEKELKSAKTEDQRAVIVNEIKSLKQQIESLEKDFERIATGVDVDRFYATQSKQFDWKEEVQDLLSPILQELKSMMESPRQIERLRTEIAYENSRLMLASKAVANTEEILTGVRDPKLKDNLKAIKDDWQKKAQQVSNQQAVLKYQLDEKLKERESVFESLQNLLQTFFKSRGRNLLFSVLSFIVVFLLLRMFQRIVWKYTPLNRIEQRSFLARAADIAYHFFTVIGATTALLIVLYASGDWVLLSLAVIFILGILWTARHGIPRFSEHIKLLLNLGTVRENERIVYKGIPWEVVSINLYTHLINPALSLGPVRIPLRELLNLHSRPCAENEPWFPCSIHDWVLLSDGTYGQIISQSPEMVQVAMLGGSRKTYLTEEFLKFNPENLSMGFRIRSTFGIDYAYQAICTTEIPEKMTDMLDSKLRELYGNDMIRVSVQFKAASSSSLDYDIIAEFSGNAASQYAVLTRAVQRICVDACNRYGWVIPFTQITVHEAKAL